MEYNFTIKDLVPIGVTLVVVTIVLAFGLDILTNIQSNFTADSVQYNATADGIEGLAEVPSQLPLIATIVVAAVIIGILMMYFRV